MPQVIGMDNLLGLASYIHAVRKKKVKNKKRSKDKGVLFGLHSEGQILSSCLALVQLC